MKKNIYLIILFTGLLMAGCDQPEASPTPTLEAVEPTATVEPIPEPTLGPMGVFEEGDCPFSVPGDQTVECGFVVVPEDHENPDGPTIKLAVAVFKDQSDAHLPDPVIILSGGPGEKTVHNAPAITQAFAPIRQDRDLIIFDQRGVGLSEPALECPEVVQVSFELLDEPDTGIAMQESFDAVMACRDRLLSEGHNLSAYNTVQNAADVEAIRVALGYEQLNLWGGSYGSQLAQATMRDYPDGIRSTVIESVYPLEVSFVVDTNSTVPDAIMRLLATCTADEACDSAYPNLQEVLFEIIDRLNAEPVLVKVTNPLDGQSYDVLLSGDAVLGNLRVVLYLTPALPSVPQAIYDVYNGDYELMTQLTGLRFLFVDAVSRGTQYSVLCADDLIGRTIDEVFEARDAFPSQLVGQTDPALITEYSTFALCKMWGVDEADPWVKEPLVSDIPTLVLSGEFDPVTPPKFGKLVAGYLDNSFFFEMPGGGHSGESTTECALSITAAFIDDPTTAPDASCIAEMPGLVFDVPREVGDVILVPYTNDEVGVSGVVPAGWNEVSPGIFTRGNSVLDATALQIAIEPSMGAKELLVLLAEGYGLAEIPESTSERQANGLTWSLYAFEVQGVPRDLALAESDGGTLIVILRSETDERALLYEVVFLPIVDGLIPLQ
ncbi:MAG: alpha/beta fold hydrolase [Anaerolineales bacterium]|nr:MAG: alpha/beta fold hydrolase [Anaerolineales bacterium]